MTVSPEPSTGANWHLTHLQQESRTARGLSTGKGRTVLKGKKIKAMLGIYGFWKRNVRATKENPDMLHSHGIRLVGGSPT